MKTHLKLASILPVLPDSVHEALDAALKDAGLQSGDVELKRAGTSMDFTLEEGERAIVQYVSTRDVDRDGEVVLPAGIDLKQFKMNPVVLWGHNYSEPPVGSDKSIEADEYGLKAKTVYASTPRAQEVWTLRKEGHLRTSSIGFVATDLCRSNDAGFLKMVDQCRAAWPEFKKQADRCRAFIRKCILLEHSDVSIPANPNALTLAVAKSLNLSAAMVQALGIGQEFTVEQAIALLEAKGMKVATDDLVAAYTQLQTPEGMKRWAESKGFVLAPKAAPEAPVIRRLSDPPVIRELPLIRVDQDATMRERVKNMLDLQRGRV